MSQIKRLILSVLVGGLLVVLAALLVIAFSPATLLPLVGMVSPYTVKADKVEVSLFSPSASVEQLSVYTEQDVLVAKANRISFTAAANNVWEGIIVDADIFVEHFPSPEASENEDDEAEKSQPNEAIDVYSFLSQINLKLENIQAHLNQDERVHVDYLRSLAATDKQAGVDFSLSYKKTDTTLPLQGQLIARHSENMPQLQLAIPELDLRSLASADAAAHPSTNTSAHTSIQASENSAEAIEAPMDWLWISSIAPLNVIFQSNVIQLEQGKVSDVELSFGFTHEGKPSISQNHRGNIALTLTPDYAIDTPFLLESTWKALGDSTVGADVEGGTTLTIGDNQFSVSGLLNLNGIVGNQWRVNGDVLQFPLVAKSVSAKELKKQSQPLFPLNVQTKLLLIDQQVSLSEILVKAGESDIKGRVDIGLNESMSALEKVSFSLASEKLVIPIAASDAGDDKASAKKEVSPKSLFSDEPLPLDIFDLFTVEGELTVAQLIYDDRLLLAESANRITLKDNRLNLTSKAGNFADGKFVSTVELTRQDQQLQLIVDSSVSDALLESLALLPKDEFSGGKTNFSLSLQGKGHSTKSLASSLNGDLLLVARKGTIGNNSFEIIGSDLILNLINSINPFYKKVKTTELECAVVKSKVENGRLLFDKSLEVNTSKMIVVADGFVDLSSEKINLGINPKARKGVGVDIASLAKFVALQGTLSDPKLGASAGGTLKSLASVGAAMSTGGLSLLASGLLDKATAEQGCARALAAFKTAEKP